MDFPLPQRARRKRQRRRWLLAGGVILALALSALGLSRLQPALPRVERSSLLFGTVRQGELVCEVRGNGTLVPEQIQFVQAETDGRIERILALPGALVKSNTVLLELSNPELEQAAFDAEWQLKGAEAQLIKLRAQLENEQLALKSAVAALKADAAQAELDARVNDNLAKDKLISDLENQRARARADDLRERSGIEQQRLATSERSIEAQLAVQRAEVERARALLERKRQQIAGLRVRAGVDGVLQQIGDTAPLQSGQRVTPSATLAKIVEPSRLKAVLKISETQVKDVAVEQKARIDTHNGIIPGEVVRIDPAAQNGTVTVDIELEGPLPRGARPDLNVDGTIELARLDSVLKVEKPVEAGDGSLTKIFKVVEAGNAAQQVPVRFGRSSVNLIEVREGLKPGDQIIISEMSQWDGHDRVRLN